MAEKKKLHLVEELESQFHTLHDRVVKAKDHYLSTHQKEHEKAQNIEDEVIEIPVNVSLLQHKDFGGCFRH